MFIVLNMYQPCISKQCSIYFICDSKICIRWMWTCHKAIFRVYVILFWFKIKKYNFYIKIHYKALKWKTFTKFYNVSTNSINNISFVHKSALYLENYPYIFINFEKIKIFPTKSFIYNSKFNQLIFYFNALTCNLTKSVVKHGKKKKGKLLTLCILNNVKKHCN